MDQPNHLTAEHLRVADADAGVAAWRRWGPYLSERAWGVVREDYSESGSPWESFPHDHARSRAYRWDEDGLAGVCDEQQHLCVAFSFWNGRDAILKERIFGLNGHEGNHGEDAMEYWWYLDATPTSSFLRWAWVYPQGEFPYGRLLEENRNRGRDRPEFELLDTGVFDDDRYWDVQIDMAKVDPQELVWRVAVVNAGPDPATLDVLPTVWFRNTWSWSAGAPRPELRATGAGVAGTHPAIGPFSFVGTVADPTVLVCDNDTNDRRLWGGDGPAFPKDGIGDHVLHGRPTVDPGGVGTKAALWHTLTVAAGGVATVYLRLRLGDDTAEVLDPAEAATWLGRRQAEADEFHAALLPSGTTPEAAAVARQAFAGMLWSKQYYRFDVDRWLEGDPAQPPPPPARTLGRNGGWRHLDADEVISMPDPWEYPWFAAWDLAFHCVTLARLDPEWAKAQLLLLCREWYMSPSGQLPAYEWSFDDVNPPVHAWAALKVYEIDGRRDTDFLKRVFHKLVINFTWWVNRKDADGNNVFGGGFLGLDNIGPIDRSAALPVAGNLEQSDGTAWMAMYALDLLEMAVELALHDPTYEDLATKFLEHFTYVAAALNSQGLWDDDDGFYYDVLHLADGSIQALKVRSIVGLIPLMAVTVLEPEVFERLPGFAARFRWFVEHRPRYAPAIEHCHLPGHEGRYLLSVVDQRRLPRILRRVLDETEFLSPHGLRALSRVHAAQPFNLDLGGGHYRVDYEPGESASGLFGGNSNWRGPVWFPVNHLVLGALAEFRRHLGDEWTIEHPTGSGHQHNLLEIIDDLARRLVSVFLPGPDGHRPVFGGYEKFQTDRAWNCRLLFHEYFHGDTGAGLGASHQTGWTGLVADLVARGHGVGTPDEPGPPGGGR